MVDFALAEVEATFLGILCMFAIFASLFTGCAIFASQN